MGLMMVVFLGLTACSSFYSSNADKRYLSSKNGPSLVVPPPMTTENISYFYNLPSQNQNARVSVKPPKG
jgi:hypothetical protein